MKKTIFVATLFIACVSASFANKRNDIFAEGMLSFNFANVSTGGASMSNTSFSLQGGAGYFIAENFNLGLRLGLTAATAGTSFDIVPNINYYVRIMDNWYYVPGFSIGIRFTEGPVAVSPTITTLSLEIRASERLAIGLSAGTISYTHSGNNDVVGFNVGGASILCRYYFNKPQRSYSNALQPAKANPNNEKTTVASPKSMSLPDEPGAAAKKMPAASSKSENNSSDSSHNEDKIENGNAGISNDSKIEKASAIENKPENTDANANISISENKNEQ